MTSRLRYAGFCRFCTISNNNIKFNEFQYGLYEGYIQIHCQFCNKVYLICKPCIKFLYEVPKDLKKNARIFLDFCSYRCYQYYDIIPPS